MNKYYTPVLTILFLSSCQSTDLASKKEATEASTPSVQPEKEITMKLPDLRKTLEEKAAASAETAPEEIKKAMLGAIDELRKSDIKQNAHQAPKKLPAATLTDAEGQPVNLQEVFEKGPSIITFYRGSWCPYCNLQLRAYQQALPEFQKRGAQLIAISPDKPDNSLSAKQKNELEYLVLSDENNAYAKSLGLVYELPEDLKKIYLEFGINLEDATGSNSWELPLSATYVVKQGGEISYAFLEEDYKKRAQPEDLIRELDKISH